MKQYRKDAKTEIERLNNSRYDTLINQLNRWQNDGAEREKLRLKDKSIGELVTMFEKKIRNYYSSLNMDSSESEAEIKSILAKIEELDKSLNNNIFKEFIIYITALPTSFVVPHLKQKSVEMLSQRVQYSFKTIEPK